MGTQVKDAPDIGAGYDIAPDVLCLRILIANVCFLGKQGEPWILVDTGLKKFAERIHAVADKRFGRDNPPQLILLTHGHFDHVGSVKELAEQWDVPVYAHAQEIPYLTGQQDYPPADPNVDNGLLAKISPFFPNKSIDLHSRIVTLPADGSIPAMPEWRWIHTPGHTPGHVSLFRERDGILIAGDAFTTVKQESALAVLAQDIEVNGPPKYFTTDWRAAQDSVQRLQGLNPSVVATGHGVPISGEQLSRELATLAHEFANVAVPEHGRYVE